MRESARPLPIDSLLPALQASLQTHSNLIIEAAPGAGKTTRVPPALLHPTVAQGGEVWVLEPRRIAARLSAQRVAEELGEPLGRTVGYQVRFEDISSPRTRLRFLTEGVLTRRLLSRPTLAGVAVVVLDEFHERHLQTDLALALLRRLQQTTRPDLKLVVMSATLDVAPLARYLGDCPILRSEGRPFDIAIEYLPQDDARPLSEQVVAALKKLIASKLDGDVLVFLPGAAEIRRAQEACASLAAAENLLVTLLHGELSTSEQNSALSPAAQRKVILSTNVAETSITIDGVVAVIDSGLARIAEHSHWSGLPTLPVQRICQASAQQRAGRAGRTRAGSCLRLFTAMDFALRPAFERPEIQRLDLAGAALELHAAGVKDLASFDWFESPGAPAIEAAEFLLQKLGAINGENELTPIGTKMLRYPLHPRQARLLFEAEARGIAERGALAAVLMNERDLRPHSFANNSLQTSATSGESDLSEREALFRQAQRWQFDATRLQTQGINPGAARAIDRAHKQLMRLLKHPAADNAIDEVEADARLRLTMLAGFPDRVAKRQESDNVGGFDSLVAGSRGAGKGIWQLSNGTMAQLASESVVRGAEFVVAVEASEKLTNRSSSTLIQTAVAIEPEWLLELFPDAIREQTLVRWHDTRQRVEVVSQMCYDQIVLAESRLDDISLSPALEMEIVQALFEAVRKQGWQFFIDADVLAQFQARLDFLQRTYPETNWPTLGDDEIYAVLKTYCKGKRSFKELADAVSLDTLLHSIFSYAQLSWLQQKAPEKVQLSGRKNVRVHYEMGQAPWLAARLQDFFGMTSGPKIAEGRASLVLHLLAPNQRPVQITQDLAGFWTRHYPQIRRELSRRYPKHAWPENPLSKQSI
jgi:ATP-dependent helicase HrpB